MAIVFNIGESVKLSAFNVLQEPIKMMLENQQEAFEKESFINKIYRMGTIDKYQEEYRSRTAMDGFLPTEDMEPPNLSDFTEGYKKIVQTQIWTNAFVISKQTVEDNQDMDISTRAIGFLRSYYRTRELYGHAMLAGALSGSATFGGKKFDTRGADTTDGTRDGTPQVYFHNAHKSIVYPNNPSYNQSNKFYVNGGIDLTAAGAHEKLLSIIGQVQSYMQDYRDDKGNILTINPTTILLPARFYKFKDTLLTALKTPYTSVMGENGFNLQAGTWNIIVDPYLSKLTGFDEADQAFIMIDDNYNKTEMGACWLDRIPLEVTSWVDNGNKANVWDGRSRYQAHFINWRAMAYVNTGVTPAYAAATTNATALTPQPTASYIINNVNNIEVTVPATDPDTPAT